MSKPRATLCVECGPAVVVDGDGCCELCGNGAVGSWLAEYDPVTRLAAKEAELEVLRAEAKERLQRTADDGFATGKWIGLDDTDAARWADKPHRVAKELLERAQEAEAEVVALRALWEQSEAVCHKLDTARTGAIAARERVEAELEAVRTRLAEHTDAQWIHVHPSCVCKDCQRITAQLGGDGEVYADDECQRCAEEKRAERADSLVATLTEALEAADELDGLGYAIGQGQDASRELEEVKRQVAAALAQAKERK